MKETMETQETFPKSAANFKMIDIGEKQDTHRRAVASGSFFAAPQTMQRIRERTLPKGDALILAEVAGIQGAKRVSELLPLCHPLQLTSVRVWSECLVDQIQIFCEVKSFGKTGVEMEALSGVNAALLCIYDLAKGVDPVLRIGEIKLDLKEGGKSGVWRNPESKTVQALSSAAKPNIENFESMVLQGIHATVITMSDRYYQKKSEDISGPIAAEWLQKNGAKIREQIILPDDVKVLKNEILKVIENHSAELIVISGGTGLSSRDITTETISHLCDEMNGKEIIGFGELMRSKGSQNTEYAWLSRSSAYLIQNRLILCLPGSPKAVQEGLDAVGKLIPHALHTARGGGHK